MPGNSEKKTRRAVVILHPDFQQNGKAGILEAKQFAKSLIDSQKQLVKIAAETQSPDIVNRMRQHVDKMTIVVRNIPEELI